MSVGGSFAVNSSGRSWQAVTAGRQSSRWDPDGSAQSSVVVTVQINVVDGQLPPEAAQLLANIQALANAQRVAPVPAGSGRGLSDPDPAVPPGGLVVNPLARSVWRDGEPIELTRREFDLLAFLCEHPRRVFHRGQLLRQVWGYEPVSGDRTVDVHVRRLRTKLGDQQPVISTVRGVGYRLSEQAQVTIERESH